jgi:hypothetical protein
MHDIAQAAIGTDADQHSILGTSACAHHHHNIFLNCKYSLGASNKLGRLTPGSSRRSTVTTVARLPCPSDSCPCSFNNGVMPIADALSAGLGRSAGTCQFLATTDVGCQIARDLAAPPGTEYCQMSQAADGRNPHHLRPDVVPAPPPRSTPSC